MMEQKNISSEENADQEIHGLSRSQQSLVRIALISDLKNMSIHKSLRLAKKDLLRNFHNGGTDASYVNAIFWLYFFIHKDVFIPGYWKSFLKNAHLHPSFASCDLEIHVYDYFVLLRIIRAAFDPFWSKIEPLMNEAKDYARAMTADHDTQDIYTGYESEEQQGQYATFAKEKFLSLLTADEPLCYCDFSKWEQQQTMISKHWEENYEQLIIFAILGMHYFNKKELVYATFDQEQLTQIMHFMPSDTKQGSLTLTLKQFLVLIEHLDFRNKVFAFKAL